MGPAHHLYVVGQIGLRDLGFDAFDADGFVEQSHAAL